MNYKIPTKNQRYRNDHQNHLQSMLMRESLMDKDLQKSTEVSPIPMVRMLPDAHVLKIGGRSIIDGGRKTLMPVVEALASILESKRLIMGTGGGARTRHVFSIGIDLGMPAGVLAELAEADALGNAHILGALLSPYGVVAIPPSLLGHMLPLFVRSVPGVLFTGVPPYSLWEHPPAIGRIPPHGSDAGCYLLAENFGCQNVTLIKDVDGLYDRDPKIDSTASFIKEISTTEIRKGMENGNFETLPFEPILLDLLDRSRLVGQFQIVNGLRPEKIDAALAGEHVGTIVRAE